MELKDHNREPTPLERERSSRSFWQSVAQVLLWMRTEARSRGGRAPKYLRGIQAYLDSLDDEALAAPARRIFEAIPMSEPKEKKSIDDYEIYRDGNKIVQLDRAGREKSIGSRAFENYVKRARNERK